MPAEYEGILYSKVDSIGTITLNRPERRNAISTELSTSLGRLLTELRGDADLRVIVVTGAGSAFCSGTDVGGLAERQASGGTPPGVSPTVSYISLLHRSPLPVIAAVNGPVAGIGISLALACDIRIAAESARFSVMWIRRGLIPDGGSTYLLPRAVGMSRALQLAWTGDMIDAQQSERIGMVSQVVPDAELMPTVMELARKLAAGPPLAIARAKLAMQRAQHTDLEAAMEFESYAINYLLRTEDSAEGIRSFLEKRQPVFRGR